MEQAPGGLNSGRRSASRFGEADAFTHPVVRQKGDAGLGERLLHRGDSAHPGVYFVTFQARDRIYRDDCLACQVLLRPAQQGASRPDLARRDHGGHNRRSAAFRYLKGII